MLSLIIYHIILETYLEDKSSESPDGYTETETTGLYDYTISDFDSEKEFTMPENIEYEGYEFKGYYYNNKVINNPFKVSDFVARNSIEENGKIVLKAKYDLYKCNVTLVVGDKTITSVTYEAGKRIDSDSLIKNIDRKFGFIYIVSEIPEVANESLIVVRVQEIPFLWIVLGIAVVAGLVVLITVKSIKKHRSEIDKKKLDVILNRLDTKKD